MKEQMFGARGTPEQIKQAEEMMTEEQLNQSNTRAEQITKEEEIMNLEQLKEDWQTFYRVLFGRKLDFSKVEIPEKQEGFDKLLIMAPVGVLEIIDKCRNRYKAYETSDNRGYLAKKGLFLSDTDIENFKVKNDLDLSINTRDIERTEKS